jgi:hypothetical protein
VAPFEELALPSQTTTLEVLVLVFEIVRSLDDPPDVLEPSIIIKSAPLSLIIELVEEPEIIGVAPVAGLIVIVLTELVPVIVPILRGKLSVVLVYVDKRLKVTGPEMPQVERSDNADVRFVKSPPTPIVFVPVIPDPQDDVAILSLKGTEAK